MSIAPGATIGIIGGGQLGRMLAQAAQRLGYRAHIYCPEPDAPALEVTSFSTIASYADGDALTRFADSVDVITFEFENIPAASLATLEGVCPIRPSASVLALTQNRLREKDFAQSLGIGTAAYRKITSADELKSALQDIPPPCILKTTELGYDGKGQFKITDATQADEAWAALKTHEAILEGFVEFSCEISVIVARNPSGQVRCFPAVENVHQHHILHQTFAPARIDQSITQLAEDIATRIAEELKLEGLLAIEMFVTQEGDVLVNELAPRPHNSGHWTLDACATTQFEQAIRAACNLPLGATDILTPCVMTNLIGNDIDKWQDFLGEPRTKLHLYGKKEARAGRKMGHITQLLGNAE